MVQVPVITIDGPSGSGKGTVAQRVAANLGYHLLDSGALYRVLGYIADSRGINLQDHQALVQLAHSLDIKFGQSCADSIEVDGEEVGTAIRQEAGGELASRVGAIPAVRQALLQRQLAFRQAPGLVADGRDMGTVVFPDATVKIFLTASLEERAKRRYNQLIAKGIGAILPDLLQELQHRDERDLNREVSPLIPAKDAFILDTTDLDIDEVVDRVMHKVAFITTGRS